MNTVFLILALGTVLAAAAAMTLRNLVHCALAMAVSFVGLAAIYLYLHAQFVGFAQVLVYVGAVAILIAFAILLTRSGGGGDARVTRGWLAGLGVGIGVFAVMAWTILSSRALAEDAPERAELSVREVGDALMTHFVMPLEVLALMLTAALIGGVVIALSEKGGAE